MSTSLPLPRETKEYVPMPVTVDGVETTGGVEYAITATNARPSVWTAAYVDGNGKTMVLVEGLAVGLYSVWARVTAGSEVAVVEAGELRIT